MRCAKRPAARRRRRPDARTCGGEVSFEPASPFRSFDHLVGEREQLVGNFEAERLSGVQIDDEVELSRLLDRKISRLRSAQNFIDVVGSEPEKVGDVWSIGY